MKWIIGFLSGFLLNILGWLTKKLGISKIVLAFQITIAVAFIAFLLSAVTFITLFIMEIWNLFKVVIDSFATVPNVAGEAYGISLSTLTSSFFGFLHESGLASAFMTAGDLLIGLVSIYMTIQMYKLILFASREIISIINTLLALATR